MMNSQTPVIVKARTMRGTLALTRVSPRLVGVVHGGTWYSALLEGQSGDRYRVHLLGWSSRPGEQYFLTNTVAREFLCLPADGPPLLVKQNGRWYPARLLRRARQAYQVHYLGYREEETVPPGRVYYPFVGQPGGRRYLVLVTTPGAGTWARLGPAGAWRGTRAGVVLKNRLYTCETNGYLYRTDLLTGTWEQVGKRAFGGTVFMFATGGWKGTRAGALFQGRLYSVEANGGLWATGLDTGTWKRIGKPEFGNTTFLFAAVGRLYTIEKDGSLYGVSLR